MSGNNFEGKQLVEDPRPAIQQIMAEVNAMGRNDSELSDFKNIIVQYESNKISAEEALSQAQQIKESKQDYN